MTSYKNLGAWEKSMELVKEIYLLTKTFPKVSENINECARI
jgi:hypothetical protein